MILLNSKDLKKFNDKYGDIPKDKVERLFHLFKVLKLKDSELSKLRDQTLKLLSAKWEEFSFIIHYTPQATPRPRAGKFGFYVKGAADNFKAFSKFMDELRETEQVGVITTPCKLMVDAYFPIPSGMNRFEKILAELKLIRPISKPDWDNVGKTYSDMIQKSLLMEDSTIIEGTTRKYYSSRPRVEVNLKFMTQYDCKFHKKKVEDWKSFKESDHDDIDSII